MSEIKDEIRRLRKKSVLYFLNKIDSFVTTEGCFFRFKCLEKKSETIDEEFAVNSQSSFGSWLKNQHIKIKDKILVERTQGGIIEYAEILEG